MRLVQIKLCSRRSPGIALAGPPREKVSQMRNSLLIAMFIAGMPWAAGAEVRVWAVSDGVRVNPVTGKLLEDRRDIHVDYPSGDFRAKNLV